MDKPNTFCYVRLIHMSALFRFLKSACIGVVVAGFPQALFGQSNIITLSVSPIAGGSVNGAGTYATGTNVTLTATPAVNYYFVDWTSSNGVQSASSSYSLTLSNDIALTANFAPVPLLPSGSEFSILGAVPGDQVWPSISLSESGGCLAWQDNWVDRKGGGIGCCLLNGNFAATPRVRVNKVVAGNQFKPQAELLANGNIVFVWQGSATVGRKPNIYARFAKNSAKGGTGYGTNFYTADVQVNTDTSDQQVDPAVAGLPDGSAIIAWSSYGEKGTGSAWGVYARRLTPAGTATKAENNGTTKQFIVTQFTGGSQRNPAVAVLAGGNYVITWVSELERGGATVDIYARVFAPNGVPVTDEIPVNSVENICHAPSVAPLNDGGFTIVWAQKDSVAVTNGWDIWGRAFSSGGTPENTDFTINTHLPGDQYAPKIAAGPSGSLVVWTSLGQDGSREGVFGRFLAGGTQVAGPEFQVNTTWISQQLQPSVAWDGINRFLVVWTSFAGASGFDLYGQTYVLNSTP